VESDRPQMTPWRMRIACWIPKPSNNLGCTKTSQCFVIRTLPVLFNSVKGGGGESAFVLEFYEMCKLNFCE
jgi:hypothetical protein